MQSWTNEKQNYCLAVTYGLNPPRKSNPAYKREVNTGKFEPDHNLLAAQRCMVLASFLDKTNCLVLYKPADLVY